MTSSAIWTVPATCGEFVQGFHRGRWLQVAAPVDLYRTAFAEIVPFERADPGAFGQYAKVRRGLGFLLHERPGCSLRVTLGGDDIPRGSGFGSSTADMGAALCAAADALDLPEPSEAAVDAALRVEPTSGSLLPGLVLFDHRAGRHSYSSPATALPPPRSPSSRRRSSRASPPPTWLCRCTSTVSGRTRKDAGGETFTGLTPASYFYV